MPAGDEFTGPVDYSSLWVWLAVGAVVAVVLFILAVWAWSVSGHGTAPRAVDPVTSRTRALAELDRIGGAVAAGGLSERAGHQRMSTVLRGYVAEVTGLPTHTMVLADLRQMGVPRLAEVVALMYPPEFAPDEDASTEPFTVTLGRARQVVASWN